MNSTILNKNKNNICNRYIIIHVSIINDNESEILDP